MTKCKVEEPDRTETICLPSITSTLLKEKFWLCADNDYLNFYRYTKMVDNEKHEPFQNPCYRETTIRKKVLQRHRIKQEKVISIFKDVLEIRVDFSDKLMISIGGTSPYSNLTTTVLHPLYGHPYIPSSALKGAIRNCWIHEEFDGDEKKALQNSLFIRCFGKNDDTEEILNQQGELVFFDGILAEDKYQLIKDVITPHYPNYYTNEGDNEPTDDQSPVILKVITLKEPPFKINIAKTGSFSSEEVEQIKRVITKTFEDYGIGAKTAVGYGLGRVTF